MTTNGRQALGDCEYCANTRIDGLTLRHMGVELPCRYCEPTAMQPDRIEVTADHVIKIGFWHILSELLGESFEENQKGDN